VNPSTPGIDHEQRVVRDHPSRGPDLAREEVLVQEFSGKESTTLGSQRTPT
jgi:hypothetical protein